MRPVLAFLRARWGWLLAAVLVLAAGGGWWWYQADQAERARQQALAAIRSETLARGDLVATVSATGSLLPGRQASLGFLIPGTVQEVLVKEGQTVTAGQVLARLEAQDLELAVAQAQDSLSIADLRRKQLLAGPTADDLAVAKANLRAANATAADVARGAGPEEAKIAELKYNSANDDFHKLNDQYNQLVQFAKDYPRFSPPQETMDTLKANQEIAYYQAEVARLQWEQAKKPADPGALSVAYARIAQAKAQLDQLLAGPTDLQKQQADLSVAQARLALEQAQARLARAELRAPFDGVVGALNLKPGEPAATGAPAVVLLDTSQFRLDVSVSEVDVAQLALGQAVSVTVDALPDTPLAGHVDRLAPTSTVVGGAVNYVVRVVLDQADGPAEAKPPLRSGMSATVQVTVAEVHDVVLAPNWAIRRDRQTGQAFLSLRDGEALKEVPIETGLRGESATEVKDGAQAGDVAAVSTERVTPFGDGN